MTERDGDAGARSGVDDPWCLTTAALFDALRRRSEAGVPTVVVTVVDVEGSGYRRPGAKFALTADGEPLGLDAVDSDSLCPRVGTDAEREDPIVDLARAVAETGRPLVETFDLTADDDTWGFGLGSNGVVTFLVEPLGAGWHEGLAALDAGASVVLATVVSDEHPGVEPGTRLVFDVDGTVRYPVADSDDSDDSSDDSDDSSDDGHGERDARDALRPPSGRPPDDTVATTLVDSLRGVVADVTADGARIEPVVTDHGRLAVFLDRLDPAPELLVFGSQGDVRPVARFARDVGFRVTVASAPDTDAGRERFPAADRVVTTSPSDLAGVVDAPERTHVVLMSHDFDGDRLALESLLATSVPYVGLMGPRQRFESLRTALAADGVVLDEADRDRISTPVGLDLGGGEPTQVAMSVVAEALAVAHGRDGGRLSTKEGPVHPR